MLLEKLERQAPADTLAARPPTNWPHYVAAGLLGGWVLLNGRVQYDHGLLLAGAFALLSVLGAVSFSPFVLMSRTLDIAIQRMLQEK
jgi:hypothetical protein